MLPYEMTVTCLWRDTALWDLVFGSRPKVRQRRITSSLLVYIMSCRASHVMPCHTPTTATKCAGLLQVAPVPHETKSVRVKSCACRAKSESVSENPPQRCGEILGNTAHFFFQGLFSRRFERLRLSGKPCPVAAHPPSLAHRVALPRHPKPT